MTNSISSSARAVWAHVAEGVARESIPIAGTRGRARSRSGRVHLVPCRSLGDPQADARQAVGVERQRRATPAVSAAESVAVGGRGRSVLLLQRRCPASEEVQRLLGSRAGFSAVG